MSIAYDQSSPSTRLGSCCVFLSWLVINSHKHAVLRSWTLGNRRLKSTAWKSRGAILYLLLLNPPPQEGMATMTTRVLDNSVDHT